MCRNREIFLSSSSKATLVLTTSFNLDWHLSANPFQYSLAGKICSWDHKKVRLFAKGWLSICQVVATLQSLVLRNLTYEFWWGIIQSIQWIIKKGDWGLYQSVLAAFLVNFCCGENLLLHFQRSFPVSRVPQLKRNKMEPLIKVMWCKMAGKIWVLRKFSTTLHNWKQELSCWHTSVGTKAHCIHYAVDAASLKVSAALRELDGEEALYKWNMGLPDVFEQKQPGPFVGDVKKVRICSCQQIKVSFFG